MKISIIGAGNVGSLAAMRICNEGLGDCLLIDILKGLAHGKALDLEDARPLLKNHYGIRVNGVGYLWTISNIIQSTFAIERRR